MQSLIYYSKAKVNFTEEQIAELVVISEQFNRSQNINGFICFRAGYFVQYLEGDVNTISSLYQRIKDDYRHDVLISLTKPIKKNLFNKWNMHFVDHKVLDELNLEYFLLGQFNLVNKNIVLLDTAKEFIWQGVHLISQEHGKQKQPANKYS